MQRPLNGTAIVTALATAQSAGVPALLRLEPPGSSQDGARGLVRHQTACAARSTSSCWTASTTSDVVPGTSNPGLLGPVWCGPRRRRGRRVRRFVTEDGRERRIRPQRGGGVINASLPAVAANSLPRRSVGVSAATPSLNATGFFKPGHQSESRPLSPAISSGSRPRPARLFESRAFFLLRVRRLPPERARARDVPETIPNAVQRQGILPLRG